MTVAQSWLRQAIGAAGASLLAPACLMAAVVALAAGGGLGGLTEIGQLVSGPGLPPSSVADGRASIADAGIVGAGVEVAAGGQTARAERLGARPGGRAALTIASAPGETGRPPLPASAPAPPAAEAPVPLGGEVGPLAEPPAPSGARPAEQLGESVREISNGLPIPLPPVAQELIDVLLPPPQR